MTLRHDLRVIADLVPAGATVLDVGCGEGELLAWLALHKIVEGRGLELSHLGVQKSIGKGLSVIQGDANLDLEHYPTKMVDYVILSQTLQTLREPKKAIEELVRIGRHVIISVPNFGHWKNRFYLALRGRMPVTKTLSYQWYDTPNIHFCTITDFAKLCDSLGLTIEQRLYVDEKGMPTPFHRKGIFANLLGEQGIFMIRRNG